MFDSVNRFVADERPGVARHFAELFGTDEAEHQAAASLSGEERKNFLRDLYMRQLHDVGGFTYVRSFEFTDRPARTRSRRGGYGPHVKSVSTGRSFSAVVISKQSFATTSGTMTSIGLTAASGSRRQHRSPR
jgi:hypothetical protein